MRRFGRSPIGTDSTNPDARARLVACEVKHGDKDDFLYASIPTLEEKSGAIREIRRSTDQEWSTPVPVHWQTKVVLQRDPEAQRLHGFPCSVDADAEVPSMVNKVGGGKIKIYLNPSESQGGVQRRIHQ